MNITVTELRIAKNDAARDHLARVGVVQGAGVEGLDIETFALNPLLSAERKWAIRFNAGGTVTIVLGMRDYGRGWFSAYFGGLASARLGIPFERLRIYYSASLPAVLQTPMLSPNVFHRGHVGLLAAAVADVIELLCLLAIREAQQRTEDFLTG